MAKNKPKGQKQKNVFHVLNKQTKQKNKAKPVTSNLKHINAAKKEKKVDSLNKIFTDVQREVKSISKCTGQEPKKQAQVMREQPREAVNVDGAAQLFSQL
ncbi:ribosomal biogenesis factor [Conger conger]|uniref:ribosomal biogenesis factor n=1 Tax=Conger conger TaxID=82655 RepID=UPI002A5AB904|nr:ribosomal biogenesis factor [Conger conger]